ncbi:MAG: RagB/SusD family nutrient uptake outer membrane protein [Bacteroidetes bacterium]|nr:MAG: RagB/SusD family nutrient uptake outer membrane protein [Bacteroidota bacterium]
MNKNNISHVFLSGILLLFLASCEDFLDLKPISEATTANAYSTANDAEAALTGLYDSFQSEYYIWDNIIFNDIISDNYYAGGDNPEVFAVAYLNFTPTNSRLFSNWSQIYNAIAKANIVLEKVPQIEDPKIDVDNRREQILGEAAFLRAYHYYQLVKMWGGVPLVIKPISSLDPSETHLPRNTEEEVYQQIISDLEFALERLPDTYSNSASVNKARATAGAANALMATVYAQKPDRDYAKVLEYSIRVEESQANYVLLSNFAHLFDGNHYNNAESVMEVQFTGDTEANWGPQLLLPPSLSGDSWRKFVVPSVDLVNAFDAEGDVIRKNASIMWESAPWADEFWHNEVGSSIPFAFKWKSANGWASTNRQYIFRLADIVLLKAEALNELGQLEQARVELNRIRTRVNLPPTPATNQQEMRMAILNERRLELCQEARRWDDLRRMGMAVEVMNNLNEIDLRTNTPVDFNMTEYKKILPIPQQERNRNPNLTQNPGYN